MNDRKDAVQASSQLAATAWDMADATRNLPRPPASCSILGNITDATRSLRQALIHLIEWHRSTVPGLHYEAKHSESTLGVMTVAEELDLAGQQADGLQETLARAHGGSSVVRWYDTTEDDERWSSPTLTGIPDDEIINDAIATLEEFGNTQPSEMDALYYQQGFDALSLAVRDLLRILGRDPDSAGS